MSPEGVYKHEMSSSINIKHEIPPPESLSSDVQITIVAPPRIERVKTEPKEQMVQQNVPIEQKEPVVQQSVPIEITPDDSQESASNTSESDMDVSLESQPPEVYRCKQIHWVPLTTSSVTTRTWL